MHELATDAERAAWSRRYQTAMRRFVRGGESGSPLPAERLGRQAARLGLETLDVVRVHEQALHSGVRPYRWMNWPVGAAQSLGLPL